jgi:hypothetical protein
VPAHQQLADHAPLHGSHSALLSQYGHWASVESVDSVRGGSGGRSESPRFENPANPGSTACSVTSPSTFVPSTAPQCGQHFMLPNGMYERASTTL